MIRSTLQHDQALTGSTLLAFGGPYGNWQALQALHDTAKQQGLPPEAVVCNGDIAAYCADPETCIEHIRHWGCRVIQGNCEEALSAGSEDCGCGFEEGSVCSTLSDSWYRYSNRVISDQSRLWMSQLPKQLIFQWHGRRVGIYHGSPRRLNEFVFPSSSDEDKRSWLRQSGLNVIITGHSGLPFVQTFEEGVWLNTGAIGMPANDGTSDTWYAVLTSKCQNEIEIQLKRLRYDWASAQQRMLEAKLPGAYSQALENGIWPSNDILPSTEKRQQGIKLEESTVRYSWSL